MSKRFITYFFALLLSFIHFTVQIDVPEDQYVTYNYTIEAKNLLSLRLDDYVHFDRISKVSIKDNGACSVEYPDPWMVETSRVIVRGESDSIYHGFIMKGKLFTFESKGVGKAPSIVSCITTTKVEGVVRACVKSQSTFLDYNMRGDKVVFVNVTGDNSFIMVRTNKELLLFQYQQDGTFNFCYVLDMTVYRDTVIGTALITKTELSVLTRWTMSVYNTTELTNKKLTLIKHYDRTMNHLWEIWPMNDYQAVAVCDNILYSAEDKQIIMFTTPKINYTLNHLVQSNHEILENRVLALRRVGRSLIVLTTVELLEYIIRDNCNDIRKYNTKPLTTFGWTKAIDSKEWRDEVDIVGDTSMNYYALHNKVNGSVYLFYAVVMKESQDKPYIHMWTKEDLPYEVDTLSIFETDNELGGQDVVLVFNFKSDGKIKEVHKVTVRRQSKLINCHSWWPKTVHSQVIADNEFCSTTIYNWTEIIDAELGRIPQVQPPKGNGITKYNPFYICKRTVNFKITFNVSVSFIIYCVIGVSLISLVVILLSAVFKVYRVQSGESVHKWSPI